MSSPRSSRSGSRSIGSTSSSWTTARRTARASISCGAGGRSAWSRIRRCRLTSPRLRCPVRTGFRRGGMPRAFGRSRSFATRIISAGAAGSTRGSRSSSAYWMRRIERVGRTTSGSSMTMSICPRTRWRSSCARRIPTRASVLSGRARSTFTIARQPSNRPSTSTLNADAWTIRPRCQARATRTTRAGCATSSPRKDPAQARFPACARWMWCRRAACSRDGRPFERSGSGTTATSSIATTLTGVCASPGTATALSAIWTPSSITRRGTRSSRPLASTTRSGTSSG